MFWTHWWGRRHYWRPWPFRGCGCGCLSLVMLVMFLVFACIAAMCSGPWYGCYW
jgi:hypothetical protein